MSTEDLKREVPPGRQKNWANVTISYNPDIEPRKYHYEIELSFEGEVYDRLKTTSLATIRGWFNDREAKPTDVQRMFAEIDKLKESMQ